MTINQHLTTNNLEAAFEIFNELSNSLGETYRGLEVRVSELTRELAQVRSERIRELAEKEKLANRLSSLLSVLPGGVIVVDQEQNIREANPEAKELLGTNESLIGKNWPDLIRNEIQGSADVKHDLQFKNGKRVSLCDRVLDAEGNQVILFTDVTELHSLQEWVSRDKRLTALGEMSARLAHQLRTPLSSALLYMSHLGGRKADKENRPRIVEKVIDRLQHIESLIDGMLMFVRGDTKTSSRFSAGTLMSELLTTVLPQAEKKGGRINVNLPEDEICITGNREALLSGLVNIVENSIGLADKPIIQIELKENSHHVEFRIDDNGPGIDQSIIDKIFDPFFTTRAGGTGLGLAIAAVIAREHGGDVEVKNLDAGGARFCFKISRYEPAPDAETADILESALTQGQFSD